MLFSILLQRSFPRKVEQNEETMCIVFSCPAEQEWYQRRTWNSVRYSFIGRDLRYFVECI